MFQHEYMSYMDKKTTARQTKVITLSDHNKQEIHDIKRQEELLKEEFNQKKQGTCTKEYCKTLIFRVSLFSRGNDS